MALIAHYRLNGDAQDSVGTNHGDPYDLVEWGEGKLGKAALVPAGQVIACGDVMPAYDFSVACWVDTDGLHSNGVAVSSGRSDSSAFILYPYSSTGRTRVFITGQEVILSDAISDTGWRHLCVTSQGAEVRLYLDGNLLATGIRRLDRAIDSQLHIGNYRNNLNNRALKKGVQDVRIYDHTLSQREVRDLSQALYYHHPLNGDFVDVAFGTEGVNNGAVPLEDEVGFQFNGAEFIDTGIEVGVDNLGQTFTWSKWMWYDRLASNLGSCGVLGTSPRLYSRINNTSGALQIGIGNAYYTVKTLGKDATNQWFHVAHTFDNGTVNSYVNGELVHTRTGVNFSGNASGTLCLGRGYQAVSSSRHEGKIKDHRIYKTALSAEAIKELCQQSVSLDNEGGFHTSLVSQKHKVRYIRDWSNGNNSNSANHWTGIKAITPDGEDVALNKPVTTNSERKGNISRVTNGTFSNYYDAAGGYIYVQIDLEGLFELDHIRVWHYSNNRTYKDTKTEVSSDGVHWTPIFDSAVSGTYVEIPDGVVHPVIPLHEFSVNRSSVTVPDISEVGPAQGLVAWYPLMGDTLDYAGTNHAENNGAVATAEGYVLDGSSGTSIDVAINDSARIPAPEGDVTVCAWIKPESDNTGYIVYCATGDSSTTGTHRYSLVQYPDGEIRFSAFGKSVRLRSIRRPGEWQHVTLTASVGGEVIAYFNGELKGSTTSGSSDNSANNLMFGARPGGVNLASTLSDVRIYDRALSPEEVALLYNLTRPDGSKSALTQDCLYTRSQFKEVIC